MRHNSTLQFRIQLAVIIILSMCDLNNILKNCGVQRGAVLKLFNKLRLQRSLRTKNTGAAQLADIICVSATSVVPVAHKQQVQISTITKVSSFSSSFCYSLVILLYFVIGFCYSRNINLSLEKSKFVLQDTRYKI